MPTDEAAPLPHQCGREALGHEPNVVQLRLSRESPVVAHGIAAVDDDGWVTIAASDGDPIKRWTHDPERLGAALAARVGEVDLRGQGLLALPPSGAAAPYTVATTTSRFLAPPTSAKQRVGTKGVAS